VFCWLCTPRYHKGHFFGSEVTSSCWCIYCRYSQRYPDILAYKVYWLCNKICAYSWILFVFFNICSIYAITYIFNYFSRLQSIIVEFSRDQRCLLSSCAQQTPWCTLQGTVHGHIPLPRTQCQQACYWRLEVRQSHPETKAQTFEHITIFVLRHVTWISVSEQLEEFNCDVKHMTQKLIYTCVC
jgi:hypothetical protein